MTSTSVVHVHEPLDRRLWGTPLGTMTALECTFSFYFTVEVPLGSPSIPSPRPHILILPHPLSLWHVVEDMAAALVSKSERAYIQASLQTTPPLRADGRSLLDFRTVLLETGVAPLANGSARLNIGKMAREGGGGTEVLAAVKLEVEDVQSGDGVDGGRVACSVTWCAPSV